MTITVVVVLVMVVDNSCNSGDTNGYGDCGCGDDSNACSNEW